MANENAMLEIEKLNDELLTVQVQLDQSKEWEEKYKQLWNLSEKQIARQTDIIKEFKTEIEELKNCSFDGFHFDAVSIAKKICFFERQLSIPETELLAKAYLDLIKNS